MRKHCLVLGLVACVGLVAAVVLHGDLVTTADDAPPGPQQARQVARPGEAPALAARAVGQARRYQLAARYEVELAQDAQRSTLGVVVDGTWALAAVRIDDDGTLLRGEFVGNVAVNTGATAPQPNASLARELARPHYIRVSPAGRVTSFHFERGSDAFAQGIVRSLATTTQLVRGDEDGTRWEAVEADAQGSFVAAYAMTGTVVEKTKLRYTALTGAASTVTRLEARTKFDVADAFVPERIASDERLELNAGGMTIGTRTELELSLLDTRPVAIEPIDLGALEAIAVSAPPRGQSGGPAADRDLVAGANLDELIAELANADEQVMSSVAVRLAALLRVDPATAQALAERLRAGADERSASVMLGALGSAGTPDAQRVLGELVDSEALAASTRADVAVAMAMVEQPLPEVTQALAKQLDAPAPELRSSSGLALGAAAAQLAQTDAARARAIVDDLLTRLARTSDPDEQAMLIRALGTTGDVRILPALRVALASPIAPLRRVAVEALRAIADPAVDGLIAQALLGDADAGVRRAAVFAIGFRSLAPSVGGLDRALVIDPDVGVRLAIVELLAQQAGDPGVRSLLARTAAHDSSDDVRGEASRALGAS